MIRRRLSQLRNEPLSRDIFYLRSLQQGREGMELGRRNCIGTGKEVTLNIAPRSVFKSCVTSQIIMVSDHENIFFYWISLSLSSRYTTYLVLRILKISVVYLKRGLCGLVRQLPVYYHCVFFKLKLRLFWCVIIWLTSWLQSQVKSN